MSPRFQIGWVGCWLCFVSGAALANTLVAQDRVFQTIQFDSLDGIPITADVYLKSEDKQKPFIVLCHQAGWSRGEYREIAPKLSELGFNCMAIDQRSGSTINDVENETAIRARAAGKPTEYADAERDMVAAIRYAKERYAEGKLILWGSSYSAALAIRIAGEHPELVDGFLAFAPGEYFVRFGKPTDWIRRSAQKIQAPAFFTSAKNEQNQWSSIYDAVPSGEKVKYLPESVGNHGSRALWSKFDDNRDYWKATEDFLKKFL